MAPADADAPTLPTGTGDNGDAKNSLRPSLISADEKASIEELRALCGRLIGNLCTGIKVEQKSEADPRRGPLAR